MLKYPLWKGFIFYFYLYFLFYLSIDLFIDLLIYLFIFFFWGGGRVLLGETLLNTQIGGISAESLSNVKAFGTLNPKPQDFARV